MRGEIVAFDAGVGEGEIAGDDFARYRFKAADARSPALLRTGARVEFLAFGGQALEISLLAGSAPSMDTKGRFDLGRVIQRTFTSIRSNWAVFFGSAALLTGIPSAVAAWGQVTMTEAPGVLPGMAWGVGALANLIGAYLLQAMVLKAAINGFNGKSTTFDSAFDVALRMALPLFGLAILVGLGMIVGFILLVVPAIFLAVIWSVAAPVLVAERRDVMESLKRSTDLTKGHRWSVFALLLIYVVLWWLIAIVVGGLVLATGGLRGDANMLRVFINPLVNIVSTVIASAGVASLYYELRTAKEGVGAEDLASVFD
jgi:hypothetical protein